MDKTRGLPPWLKRRPPSGDTYRSVKSQLNGTGLHSVCREARCPNIGECWCGGTATFMVLGDVCTRSCRFCSVSTARKPPAPDPEEPKRLAAALSKLNLRYAVLTTVCRDDLPDQGAGHLAACVREARRRCPELLIEFLIQDFRGDRDCLSTVVDAGPNVLAHNVETVERLTHPVRDPRAGYRLSLEVLRGIKSLAPAMPTKSSLMVGLGETEDEVLACFQDLREAEVDILTIGQYLRPTGARRNLPVAEYIEPERFDRYGRLAREAGFRYVASGPFVRSSYRAAELFLEGELREPGTKTR